MNRLESTYTMNDGRTFSVEIGTVDSTHIGFEDHGLFTVNINFQFGTSVFQGTGHRILSHESMGTDFIERCLKVIGSDKWEHLTGKSTLVLRGKKGWGGMIEGIANLHDPSNVFLFSDLES